MKKGSFTFLIYEIQQKEIMKRKGGTPSILSFFGLAKAPSKASSTVAESCDKLDVLPGEHPLKRLKDEVLLPDDDVDEIEDSSEDEETVNMPKAQSGKSP